MKEISGYDAEKMLDLVSQAGRMVIVTHVKPDGDAMGSSIALHHFLDSFFGKKAVLVLPTGYPSNLGFMAEGFPEDYIVVHEDTPALAEEAVASADLIFCLDFNSFHRTEHLEDALDRASAPKVLIDHHPGPDTSRFSVIFSEIEVSSTSELLYHILMKTPQTGGRASSLSPACATALYTGMTTDTNNFANSTFPSSLMMAAELIAAGVDREWIVGKVMHSYRENRLRLLGAVLKDRMRIIPEGGAITVLDKKTLEEYGIEEGDTEGFVNVPLDIADVRLSILIKEDEGKARVSLRSKRGTSANRCATRYFRGGGHENASGGRIVFPDDIRDISEASDYATERIREFLTQEKENQ
ncbi:MAG: bifunctional oligoribonuclease/PAP phosphatase NrnA [Candidatus Cryptobacteroides sp.]